MEPDRSTESRMIGFLPSYLPDSTDSGTNTQSYGTAPPPYPSDLSSTDHYPFTYSPGLSGYGKNNSYGPGVSYDIEPPPYLSESTNEDRTNIPPMKGFYYASPSAPSVNQIDYRTGLTQIEKQVILNALSNMKANALWRTPEEKSEFSRAKDKVLELLHDVESRLTNSEKEEFLEEVRKISLIRSKEEKRQHSADIPGKQCSDHVTIWLKIIEVTTSIIMFFIIQELNGSLNRRLTLLFFELTGILATSFTISYWFNPKQSRTVRILDIIFCIFGTAGCGFAGYFSRENRTGVFSILAMVVYGLDTLWKLCKKRISYG